jgi:ankyrin repeat protein
MRAKIQTDTTRREAILTGPHAAATGKSIRAPRHQAAGAGHEEVVRLLVERGARLDLKDVLWRATPADWAKHAGKTEIEEYLRRKVEGEKRE